MNTKKSNKKRPAGTLREFILKNIEAHSKDIVELTAGHFKVTRAAVSQQLQKMVLEGRVVKKGATRGTTWLLAPSNIKNHTLQISANVGEDQIWKAIIEPEIKNLFPSNVFRIIQYGFTEMMNNIIDHSEAKTAVIQTSLHGDVFSVLLKDKGVGIFQKIQHALHLANAREAILELTKGKVTTDPTRHSGEGIFFTSRVFDRFEIESRGLLFLKDNLQDDWLIDSRDDGENPGTIVKMTIRKDATTEIHDVFAKYADPDTHRFDRTHIVVELAKDKETDYVSRSQAKRILSGLEKFERVVLDFRNVKTVGQAFVDEVFRVFAQSNPNVKFESINMNANIEFMINRGIATA